MRKPRLKRVPTFWGWMYYVNRKGYTLGLFLICIYGIGLIILILKLDKEALSLVIKYAVEQLLEKRIWIDILTAIALLIVIYFKHKDKKMATDEAKRLNQELKKWKTKAFKK